MLNSILFVTDKEYTYEETLLVFHIHKICLCLFCMDTSVIVHIDAYLFHCLSLTNPTYTQFIETTPPEITLINILRSNYFDFMPAYIGGILKIN